MKSIEAMTLEELEQPIRTSAFIIPKEWLDYNNHMNESRYLQCFSEACDSLVVLAGFDEEYLEDSGTYFTVETHIRNLGEATYNESLYITIQILKVDGKRLHIFQRCFHGDGRLIATAEQMLVHVDYQTRKACDPCEPLKSNFKKLEEYHKALPLPEGVGRYIGQPR